jgi:predicted ATPase/DNA-binding SARP family transcriptional activator
MVSELRFAVLGPVRAWRGEAELDLGTPQQRTVLAVLLLAEGRQVSASALVDALWGSEPPKAAAGTLRTYISRLRQGMAAGGGQAVIESAGAGYALPVPSDAVDLGLFLERSAQARTVRGNGETAKAAIFLRDALALWQGEPLAGLPGEYAEAQRGRLTELQLAAMEDLLGLEIELGEHVAAAAELRTLAAAHPLREQLSELLMLALYRAGRQADALAVFDRARRTLSEELGIDPGPGLQEMHQRILQTDRSLIGAAVPEPRPQVAVEPSPGIRPPSPLPVEMTSLYGREQAIDEVVGLVERSGVRLVTLTGPGGVGKTRLVVAVGERLRDRFGAGTVFVPLDTVSDPRLVLPAIGRMAGADLSNAGSPLDALVEMFGDGAWLLIVDNLEQVVEVARDLGELLARCPGVAILATSRTVLGLRVEREYPVPPLPTGPAAASVAEVAACPSAALFVDRARSVRHGFALTDANAAVVAEICRRLEGVPLAIELAAARTRLLDPAALLARLAASLDALGAGAVDLPERQRTLRATVEWSMSLLQDAERSLLEAAAVFADGWTLPAAAAVAGVDEGRALELTEALARQSLIHVDVTKLGPRARMLETIREFVQERLAARPDAVEVGRRHADYYRAMAEQADRPLRGAGRGEWLERLKAEEGNLATAVRWYLAHDPRPLPHLFRVLWLFWLQQDLERQARPWVRQLLSDIGTLSPRPRAELAWTAGMLAVSSGDDAAALVARQSLAPLITEIHDPFLHAASRLLISMILPITGDFGGALREATGALGELRRHDEPVFTALAAFCAAAAQMTLGRYDGALRHLREARALSDDVGSDWLPACSRVHMAILAVLRGQPDEGQPLLEEALDLSLTARSTPLLAMCISAHAWMAFADGDPERAARLEGAAQGLRRRVGLLACPLVRQMESDLTANIRRLLGPDRFDEAFWEGFRLSQQEALAIAMDLLAGRKLCAAQSP